MSSEKENPQERKVGKKRKEKNNENHKRKSGKL